MKNGTITLAIEGEVVLQDFAIALNNFDGLLKQLSVDAGDGSVIDWRIEDLQAGSAIASFVAIHPNTNIIQNVIDAVEMVWDSLGTEKDFPFSDSAKKQACALTSILSEKITGIRLEADGNDHIISKKMDNIMSDPIKYSIGSINGVVETLSKHNSLSFTLWDTVYNKAIKCYFTKEQEDQMRNIWGRKVTVTGKIGRLTSNDRPHTMRDIDEVSINDEIQPGSFLKARGILHLGKEKPEDLVRRLRDV